MTDEIARTEDPGVIVEMAQRRLVVKLFEGTRETEQEEQWAYVDSLSPGLQMLWTTNSLDGEVLNGGFHQYFFNSSHCYVEQTMRDLAMIGAEGQLWLLTAAVGTVRRVIPTLGWRERSWRSVFRLAGDLPRLDALSKQYWALEPTIDVFQAAYVARHRKEFILD